MREMRGRAHLEYAYKPASKKDFVAGIIALFIAITIVIIFDVDEYGFLFLSTRVAWIGIILLGLLGGVENGRCIEVYSRRACNTPPTD